MSLLPDESKLVWIESVFFIVGHFLMKWQLQGFLNDIAKYVCVWAKHRWFQTYWMTFSNSSSINHFFPCWWFILGTRCFRLLVHQTVSESDLTVKMGKIPWSWCVRKWVGLLHCSLTSVLWRWLWKQSEWHSVWTNIANLSSLGKAYFSLKRLL